MSDAKSIKPRERDSIIQALRAGVVPRIGLRHIQYLVHASTSIRFSASNRRDHATWRK